MRRRVLTRKAQSFRVNAATLNGRSSRRLGWSEEGPSDWCLIRVPSTEPNHRLSHTLVEESFQAAGLWESELQIWPKRKLEHAIQQQLPRKSGINILWLCRDVDVDLGPMRKALAAIEGAQFDHHASFGEMKIPYEFPDEGGYQLDLRNTT
jgi:hypothetical protein